MTENAKPRQVILTPLKIERNGVEVVCIAVRNPVSEEVTSLTLSSHDLAEKADISLERAQEIFDAALHADACSGTNKTV